MSPMLPHSVIQGELVPALNAHARRRNLGRAYPELRTAFGGAAQVTDISFYAAWRVPRIVRKAEPTLLSIAPDIAVQILSTGQTLDELRRKLRHSLKHGSKLGWLIHPIRKVLWVLRPRQKATLLKSGDTLEGEEVLAGFAIPIDEMFGWLDQS